MIPIFSTIRRGCGLALLAVAMSSALFAPSAKAEIWCDSVTINFRQSKTDLDTAYMDNEANLRTIRRHLDLLRKREGVKSLQAVRVSGAASPEGSVSFNNRLSHQRADRIFEYMGRTEGIPDSMTEYVFRGRDWAGLRRLVAEDPKVPSQTETLDLIDRIIANNRGGEREDAGNLRQLKALKGGKPYKYMFANLFPRLREARLILVYDITQPFVEYPEMPVEAYDIVPSPAPGPQTIDDRKPVKLVRETPFFMDLRTNLLYDAATVPNIGVDFYLAKGWSIGANWMYAWWDSNRRHRYWRLYGGDLNVRKFFGSQAARKPLSGHHAGLYGQLLTYDFEFGGKGYLGGKPGGTLWDRSNWGVGLEYGYSLPVAGRLNIDFTIGVGYLQGEYINYNPRGGINVWQSSHMLRWVGPTKAEVSLVWMLGRGNTNKSND